MPPTEPQRRGVARRLRGLLLVALIGTPLALALWAFSWLVMAYPQTTGPGGGRTVELRIEPQRGVTVLAEQLAQRGAVREPILWAAYAFVRGAGSRLRSGIVLVQDSMTPLELLQRVARGYGAAEVRVVIPEGFTRFDIARRLARFGLCTRAEFLAVTRDRELLDSFGIVADSAEGHLFPDTYRFHDGLGARRLAERLLAVGHKRFGRLAAEHRQALARLREQLGFTMHDVMILASIVEKEAALASELPIIAGVFLNRLRDPEFRPRRLQADPTVAYGCLVDPELASCEGFDGRQLTRAMLSDTTNPYNTYRHEGLPPGPIANPGLSAVEAVLDPVEHEFLYFVAAGGGRHAFSVTLDAHNRAVDAYRTPE